MTRTSAPVPHPVVRYRPAPRPGSEIGPGRTYSRRSLVGALAAALAVTTTSCATSSGASSSTNGGRRRSAFVGREEPSDQTSAGPPTDRSVAGEVSDAAPITDVDRGPGPVPPSPPAASTTTSVAPKTVLSANPKVPTRVPLPQPIAPPIDDDAPEPVVELGSLAIPAIGLDTTLYEGIRLPTFDLGPGHWPGSAMPGQIGNMVIGGHRTVGNADFRHLDQLRPGDEMIVTDSDGARPTYVVDRSEITDPFAARMIHQTPEPTATLFACHPPGSVTRRIVVHLTLLE